MFRLGFRKFFVKGYIVNVIGIVGFIVLVEII